MNKKVRKTIYISGTPVILAILLFGVIFLKNSPYRKQIPEYPEFKSIPAPLKAQILASGRKAYLNPAEDNLGTLGMVYYSCTEYDKAIKCFEQAVRRNEKNWIWHYYLGYINLELGESQASIENFKHVTEKDPENYFALFHTAEAYQNLGLLSEAEISFKKIASIKDQDLMKGDSVRNNDFPLQIYASFKLARIYLNMNYLDSAESTLREIINRQITFGPAYRLLGDVYTRQGNLSMGNHYKTRANDLADYTPPPDMLIDEIAFISRSDTYLLKIIDDAIRSENYKWALKLCLHALKYYPDNKYLISKTIFGYFVLGIDKEALPYLNKHMNLFSDDFNELIHLADLLYSRGLDLEALKYFELAKKLKPENSRLAVWLMEKGMENEAQNLIGDQLKKDPENAKILSDATIMMLNFGNKEEATEYLKRLQKISPSNPEVLKTEGIFAEAEGNLERAISFYEELLKANQKDLITVKRLSGIYIREKMWDKAIIHFRSALLTNPNEPYLLAGLGNILFSCPDLKLRNVTEATEYFERTFINYKSTFSTKISAGKDLAAACALSGDLRNASRYINLTIALARDKKIPIDFAYFENLRRQYRIPE